MKYTMTAPCNECPFRRDRAGFLRRERASDIVAGLLAEGENCKPFQCHKTINTDTPQHCAGALILMEKNRMSNLAMSLAQRYGGLDLAKLDVGHPHVFHKFKEFVEHHARNLPGVQGAMRRNAPAISNQIALELTVAQELPDEPEWRPVGKP